MVVDRIDSFWVEHGFKLLVDNNDSTVVVSLKFLKFVQI